MTEYTAEMAHAAAARGARWLDKRCPDWPSRIDVAKLDLGDVEVCMLGQTGPCLLNAPGEQRDYGDVMDHFAPRQQDAWAARLGFILPAHAMAPYEMLTIAWRELIRQRLEAQS